MHRLVALDRGEESFLTAGGQAIHRGLDVTKALGLTPDGTGATILFGQDWGGGRHVRSGPKGPHVTQGIRIGWVRAGQKGGGGGGGGSGGAPAAATEDEEDDEGLDGGASAVGSVGEEKQSLRGVLAFRMGKAKNDPAVDAKVGYSVVHPPVIGSLINSGFPVQRVQGQRL